MMRALKGMVLMVKRGLEIRAERVQWVKRSPCCAVMRRPVII